MCLKLDPAKKCSRELFNGQVNNFFKDRTETNGWHPCDCEVVIENKLYCPKLHYLRKYEQKENVKLAFLKQTEIKDCGSSQISLDSFWSYLGMRESLLKTA